MKIGILNFQFSKRNYGAVLQAAALEAAINGEPGCVAEHIDLVPPPRKVSAFKRAILPVRRCASKILRRDKTTRSRHPIGVNPVVFEQFRNTWITRTKRFDDMEAMCREPWDYDAAVVGSDQVWRLRYTRRFWEAFFLAFLPATCRKIAYAASFGTDQWEGKGDPKISLRAREHIQAFDTISVREKSGVALCRDEFSVEAAHVLDPTLLVGREFFDTVIEQEKPEVSPVDVAYYRLSYCDSIPYDLGAFAKSQGCSSSNIYFTPQPAGEVESPLLYQTVPAWLESIRSCKKLIITDSFHCTCFAILFEKEFAYVPSNGRGMSRLESLLGELGLSDRICLTTPKLVNALSDKARINYDQVNARMETLRAESKAFLHDALLAGRRLGDE
jgi:hypothetical protein